MVDKNLFVDIKLKNRVEVEFELGGVKSERKYETLILDDLGDNKYVIQMVKVGKYVYEFPVSARHIFSIYTENGIYKVTGKILEYRYDKENPVYGLAIVQLNEISEKIQRRKNFRYNCNLPMVFSIHDGTLLFNNNENHGVIVDLSGGGIKFYSNCVFIEKMTITIELFLNNDIFFLDCQIIHVDELDNQPYRNQYRAKFLNLLDSDRDSIVQYVLNQQQNKIKTKKNII